MKTYQLFLLMSAIYISPTLDRKTAEYVSVASMALSILFIVIGEA